MDPRAFARGVLAFFLLVTAFSAVTWRQSRSLEALAELDDLRRQTSVAAAERVELERDIQVLESRATVVSLARDVLGMHTPQGEELALRSAVEAR